MNNSIIASILFSFKGEALSPSCHIDLDTLLLKDKDLSQVHNLVASGQIDPYSYAYEVMQVSEVTYSDATGLAEQFLQDKQFDFDSFRQEWIYQKNLNTIQDIAKKHMDIDDLEKHSDLKGALMEALNQGNEESL